MMKVPENLCRACISVNTIKEMIYLDSEEELFLKYINLPVNHCKI